VLEELEGCEVEPETPEAEDVEGGDEVVVLVDSLEEDDVVVVAEEVVVDGALPLLGAGGLIAGSAPPAAGHVSVTAVMPPPASAESATRRSQRRGVISSLADPSLICRQSLDLSRSTSARAAPAARALCGNKPEPAKAPISSLSRACARERFAAATGQRWARDGFIQGVGAAGLGFCPRQTAH